MVIPLRGIGSVWKGLGGGRHKSKQGGASGEPDKVRRINILSVLEIYNFEFLSFDKMKGILVVFPQAGWPPVASLKSSK